MMIALKTGEQDTVETQVNETDLDDGRLLGLHRGRSLSFLRHPSEERR